MKKQAYILLVFMVVFSSVGNVLLSKGMKQIGDIDDYRPQILARIFFETFTNGTIWLGIGSLLLFLITYLLVLSWADFSFVQPASAIGYAVVAVLGYLVLGEIMSPLRWVAVLFICAGVALVSGTEPRTAGD